MRKLIVTLVAAGAVAVAALGGATDESSAQVSRPSGNLELEWGTGAPPKYVALPSRAVSVSHRQGKGPLFELRWGTGGPPVLVRLDAD